MYCIESRINGRWVRLSNKRYSAERAANLVAYMVEDVEIEEAGEDYRYVPA